ncbi:DUF5709 domain-containing protein [Streptomyces sp. ODS28]|uniref:DUF5709 domain-containing protein n=1 Tax=Streptomyces sp. ODS28 TaxID=3136688 RepID=UPI0031E77C5D
MDGDSVFGDEVYQPDGSEVQDDEGLLDAEDTLLTDSLGAPQDPYDLGYAPPDRPLGAEHYGDTAAERERGESLDQHLAEEEPDVVVPDGDGADDGWTPDGEPLDPEWTDPEGDREEAARVRAGHLVSPDEGLEADEESELIASDDGSGETAASEEEAAVQRIAEEYENGYREREAG